MPPFLFGKFNGKCRTANLRRGSPARTFPKGEGAKPALNKQAANAPILKKSYTQKALPKKAEPLHKVFFRPSSSPVEKRKKPITKRGGSAFIS